MSESHPELSDTARVQAQVARMDALLAAGKAAVARVDEFYAQHGIRPGTGAKMLQGEDVPERHRIIFARILAEFSKMEQRIEELDPTSQTSAPVAVGTRAVGNRYRI